MRNQNTPSASVFGAALASAGLIGAAWLLDARRRRRRAKHVHRTLVELLLNSLTAGDPVTARHSRRVADLSFVLARRLGMGRHERATLRVAALLHDMGKIDDRFFDIIHSREPLTPEQREEIEHHPSESAHILAPLEGIHPGIRGIVSSHHECWNGDGYPCGLRGEEIPLPARIIALADVFDAVTQARKYRGSTPVDEVFGRLREGSGRQFDPALVALLGEPAVEAQWREIAREGAAEETRAALEEGNGEAEAQPVACTEAASALAGEPGVHGGG